MNLLSSTLTKFDQLNADDPNTELLNGQPVGKELLYSQRMSERLKQFKPDASEVLQLAAHSQHIQRWKSPRSDYPEGRSGYIKWRQDLGSFHASVATDVMREQGYSEDDCQRVTLLLQKKGIKRDDEVQCLEDVICLVFIEHYLLDFVNKYQDDYSQEKLFRIVQKTWKKMSAQGHDAALKLPLSDNLHALIKTALGL